MNEICDLKGRSAPSGAYLGPDALALADWRRRIAALYAAIRAAEKPAMAWRCWREARSAMFRDHPMSPLAMDARAGFGLIDMFDYDPALRFEVGLDAAEGPSEPVDLGADGRLFRRPAARTQGLAGPLGGELTLYWIEGYGGGLFLPFTDATSGAETYGGGRYLIDAIKGADLGQTADGRVILDFNFAYHPSCALNPAWVCPLAPPENCLTAAVRGGERLS